MPLLARCMTVDHAAADQVLRQHDMALKVAFPCTLVMYRCNVRYKAMLHHAHAAWKVRRGAGAEHALKHMVRITPLSARPMRTSPFVASCRPWVLAGMLGGPNSRAALSSGDVGKLQSGLS